MDNLPKVVVSDSECKVEFESDSCIAKITCNDVEVDVVIKKIEPFEVIDGLIESN
jgi:ribosomal protein L31